MFLSGILFCADTPLNEFAKAMWMFIVRRIFLRFGIGFANQSVPLYLSEIVPYKYRGALNNGFQLAIMVGILVANVLDFFFTKIKGGWGWRLSLGGAVVPTLIVTRGVEASEAPLDEPLVEEVQALPHHGNTDSLLPVANWDQCDHVLHPVLFNTFGFENDTSLMSAVISGLINVGATLVSIYTIDKTGTRILFLEGGTQMLICQIGGDNLSKGDGVAVSVEAEKLVMEAALTSSWEEDAARGRKGANLRKLRMEELPLMVRAVASWARAAIFAVEKLLSQISPGFFLARGSAIVGSATTPTTRGESWMLEDFGSEFGSAAVDYLVLVLFCPH
ncbi:hypothetical protein NL676_007997 [Syzygium grande]|nr:hypothetical protein NL676_007997 [Syzygium grande]